MEPVSGSSSHVLALCSEDDEGWGNGVLALGVCSWEHVFWAGGRSVSREACVLTQPWSWLPQGPPDRPCTSDHKALSSASPSSVAEAGSRPHGRSHGRPYSEGPTVKMLRGAVHMPTHEGLDVPRTGL